MTAAEQSTTQIRARRPVFIAAFLCAWQGESDDEGVNFLLAEVRPGERGRAQLSSVSVHRDRGACISVEAARASGIFDPDPEVDRAGGRPSAVPRIGVARRVALQQLPGAVSLPPGPELIAWIGTAGRGGGERDLCA